MRRPFIFAVKSDDQGQAGSERLVNLYAERKNGQFQLRSCLGLGDVVTTLPGVVRASLLFDGKLMAVAGGHLVNVLTGTDHGYIGDGFATMASNGAQLAITAGGTYAVWDGTTLSFPSIGNLTGASSVAFARGFMVITDTTGGQFAVSASYDATSINALDFATAEQQPDDVVRVVEHFGEVVLFGRESIEYWPVSGAADFPLSFSGNVLPYGCPNPDTIRKIDGGLVFVGGGGSDDEEDTIGVYRVQAYQPQRVSTHAIEEILSGVDPATLRASIYVDNGHQMYCLHLPDQPALCLDISTGLWHDRSSGVEEGPWDALGLFRDGITRRYLATLSDGSLRALSGRTTEAGSEFLRRAYSQPFRQGGERFTINSFDAHMKVGEGDGYVRLALSRDGVTWSEERDRSLGALGARTTPVRWHSLGQYDEVSARLSVTDPVDVQVFGTSAEIQVDG